MSKEDLITVNSSKEEVADYFVKKFRIKEDAKNNFIKEEISGDILYDLDDKDFKKLGIGLGPLKKVQTFLKENKEKFGEKEITEKITIISKPEEVSDFFKNCLNFSGDLNNLDGKGLIELDDEGIKNLGLNMGQSKKIVKYIKYFKTLKVEIPEKKEILLRKESSSEQVAEFFEKELKLSTKAIKALDLDGETLFSLKESDIEEQEDLTEEEKEKLKNYLKENINLGQNEEKKKEDKNIDSQKKEDLKKEQNDSEQKNKIVVEKKENDKIVKGKEKEKEKLENKPQNEKKINTDDNKKIKDALPPKEDKKLLEQKLKNENVPKQKKIYEGKKVEKVEYTAINEYKISPLITDEKYNIFFLFLVKEKNIKNLSLATYVDDSSFLPFGSSSYIMYKHYYIYENSYININHEKLKCFIMQIPSHKKIIYKQKISQIIFS